MNNEDKFDWDEGKRAQTLRERKIDFADMVFFDFDTALTAQDSRYDYPERRFVSIGFINDRLHVAVWCYRNNAIRVISLRKANSRERKRYEEYD